MATMPETAAFPLRVVDGYRLEKRYRDALQPNGLLCDSSGRARQLPRYFYEITSWEQARAVRLAPHFDLWEFIQTDVREADPQRAFPRYVPCAITMLALALERFRDAVGALVHIAANGGYRSPRHAVTRHASPHCWGSAANIYRIGDAYLDTRQEIERYGEIARAVLPGAWVRPFGQSVGFTDDHLHVDFGYVLSVPHEAPGDAYNPKLHSEPL
jgi:hypothetical protein